MTLPRHTRVPQSAARGLRRSSPWLLYATAACMLAASSSAQGQRPKATEYEVKAAYLYNFGKFIEWPATAVQIGSDSFEICVLGQDPFGRALDAAVANETIAGKRVVVREIPVAEDVANCRVLFISSSEDKRLNQILASLGAASVLTVSDLPGFTQRGGMVQFVMEDSKVRFEVNSATAERAGLILSSELLKVSRNVRKGPALGN